MSWDLVTAKAYLGVTDSSQDVRIQLIMDTTLSMVESYLQRGLLHIDDVSEDFHNWYGQKLLLSRYPVSVLESVDGGEVPGDWTLLSEDGIVLLPAARSFQALNVVYDGGYQILPPALERAMWEIFRMIWSDTDETTGGPEEGTGGMQGDDVRSLTVFDGFKMDFASPNVIAASDSIITRQQATWGPLAPWASTLEIYRSERGLGVA